MATSILEISNKGLRSVQLNGKTLTFNYEDGRKIVVTFTISRKAAEEWRTNHFFEIGEGEATFNILYGIGFVDYLEPL